MMRPKGRAERRQRDSRRLFELAHVLLPIVVAGGCAAETGSRDESFSVSDSAGIRIVENLASDRPLALSPVKLADMIPPDSVLAAVPWGVAADPTTGRIYAVDRTGERVVVFDGAGEYVGTYGRRGAGPGEFRNASALSIGPQGTLTVWDTGRGVLSRWSGAGEHLGDRPAPLAYWGPGFYERAGRVVAVISESSGLERTQMLAEVSAGDTVVLHTVPRALVRAELPCTSQPMPRLFAPDVVWAPGGDAEYVLNGPEYRIDAYVNGELASSVRRAVEPIRVTEAMAVERARWRYGTFMRRCGVTPEQMAKAVGHEPLASSVQWLAVDPGGRLWVTRSPNGMVADHVDIFDADGRYEGTIAAPGIPVAFLSGSVFVVLTVRPATGATVLSLYELRELDGSGTASSIGPLGS